MTIIQKHHEGVKLTPKEEDKEKILFLNYLTDLKTIIKDSLPEAKKQLFDKTLSLLLIYFPVQWKRVIFNQLTPEIIEKLIEEEEKGEY